MANPKNILVIFFNLREYTWQGRRWSSSKAAYRTAGLGLGDVSLYFVLHFLWRKNQPFHQGILRPCDLHSTEQAEVTLQGLKQAVALNGSWGMPNFPDDRGIENWECHFSQMLHGAGIFTYIYHPFKPSVGIYYINLPVPWSIWAWLAVSWPGVREGWKQVSFIKLRIDYLPT